MRVKFNILINRDIYDKKKRLLMINGKSILKVILSVSITILLLFHINNILNSYQLQINSLNKEVYELNEYIDELIDYIESTPDTVVVESFVHKTRTVFRTDTVLVQTVIDYYDIDSTLIAPFSLVDKQMGAFIQLEGYSLFEWNVPERKYTLIETTITDKLINLNLSADYSVTGSDLSLRVSNSSTNVNITFIENQTLDLSRVHIPEKSRWGLGIVGGMGLLNTGFTPFIGVGVSYQFVDISFKK
jgi:hypothetical protein